jgi:hypothetical protein
MKTSKKKEIVEKYKTANYYARAVVFGFFLWFASIFVMYLSGFSAQISSSLGGSGQILALLILLFVCLAGGYLINRFTWKYMLINKL